MPYKNNHPRGGQGFGDLRIRPNIFKPIDFDEAIDRHGQPVRWLKAQPCPVMTSANRHDLKCKVCHGRGEIYSVQRKFWHYTEESPHGLKDPNVKQSDKVVFWDSPVIKVGKIIRPKDTGSIEYVVVSHDETSAIIQPPAGHYLPEYYEPLHCDYAVDMWEKFSYEFEPNGKIYRLPIKENEYIAKLDYAKYKAMPPGIKIGGFNVDTVYLDSVPTKTFEIRGYKSRCPIMAIMPFESMKNLNLKVYQHAEGDVVAICSDSFKIGKGDIITSLVMRQRSPEVFVRSDEPYDTMPFYDVAEIDGNIVDEDGVEYENGVDFNLWDYNKIQWESKSPSSDKKYSANPVERITWRVHKSMPEVNSAQGRVFPAAFHLQRMVKGNPGTLQPGLKNEDTPVGDWSGKFRLQ